MSDRAKELELDIAELKELLLTAERPSVQEHLANYLSKLKTQAELLAKIEPEPIKVPAPIPVPVPLATETAKVSYTPLTKYAWDQEGKKVKIYFTLDGIGEEITPDKIDVIFDKESVEVRLRGYRGQNLIFAIKKLFSEIVVSESKYIVKKNALNLTLVKKDSKSWSQLAYKDDKFKEEKKEKEEDPQDGIMKMMKKMYDEGDENMKRTIAEAWTKANDKKGNQPDFKDRMDFLNK